MTHYFTPEQEKQVTQFVDDFVGKLNWMKSPDGVESLSDKATLDDGSISEDAMIRWFIMYGFDAAHDAGIGGQELHDLIASAVLGWAIQSFVQEDRDALRPLFEKYIND